MLFQLPNRMVACISTETVQMGHPEPRSKTRRYWWVNQNQTFRQEIQGGYLWSPKRNSNGAKNPFYEFMREVVPGDLIFSFVDTRIIAIGRSCPIATKALNPSNSAKSA